MRKSKGNPEVIRKILSDNQKERNQALTQVYNQCFPLVRQYVYKNSGSLEEAKDLFQETICIVYHNLSENKFRGESSINKYIVGIARNLWLLKLRKKSLPTTDLENQHHISEAEPDRLDTHMISHVISQLNNGCQQVLRNFYYDMLSMEEIAKNHNLGSTQAAKTKKLRCMKKLASIMEGYGLEKHHFIL